MNKPIQAWPADKVERRPVKDLVPAARNARTHSAEQVALIARSIEDYGWTTPALVDEAGNIIAGHGRILAAQKLKLDTIPVMVAAGWTDEQKRAYLIADNAIPLQAGWNPDLLREELKALGELGFDLGLIGFGDEELSQILGLPGGSGQDGEGNVSLADRFGVAPFSVLNAREGWWQDRKRAWLALGIKSEIGRGELANDRGESSSARMNDAREGQERYKRKPNGITGGSPEPLPRARAGKQSVMKGGKRKPNAAIGGSPMPLDRIKRAKANATPGGAKMPAANYSKNKSRGDGRGRPVSG